MKSAEEPIIRRLSPQGDLCTVGWVSRATFQAYCGPNKHDILPGWSLPRKNKPVRCYMQDTHADREAKVSWGGHFLRRHIIQTNPLRLDQAPGEVVLNVDVLGEIMKVWRQGELVWITCPQRRCWLTSSRNLCPVASMSTLRVALDWFVPIPCLESDCKCQKRATCGIIVGDQDFRWAFICARMKRATLACCAGLLRWNAYSYRIFGHGVAQLPAACPDWWYLVHCYAMDYYYFFISQTPIYITVSFKPPISRSSRCAFSTNKAAGNPITRFSMCYGSPGPSNVVYYQWLESWSPRPFVDWMVHIPCTSRS